LKIPDTFKQTEHKGAENGTFVTYSHLKSYLISKADAPQISHRRPLINQKYLDSLVDLLIKARFPE
jgi:hypothetical protein